MLLIILHCMISYSSVLQYNQEESLYNCKSFIYDLVYTTQYSCFLTWSEVTEAWIYCEFVFIFPRRDRQFPLRDDVTERNSE